MSDSTPQASQDLDYQNRILQGVSRTFALTIPQLPDGLRDVVGNAYLLCRIADTIEDDKDLSTVDKRLFSEMFIEVVKGTTCAGEFAGQLHPALSVAATDDEKDLIKNAASVIRITHGFNDRQRAALERCVRIMADGMVLYQEAETLAGLKDQAAMDEYCYYVAGVVGEMLTELFCDYSGEINRHHERLMQLAVSFGQGLQMTNILKDIWDDRERGACWLPAAVFEKSGFDLNRLEPGCSDPGFHSGMGELIGVARHHLENALQYTLLLPAHETGLRKFCLWALGMAVLTLRKINNHREFSHGSEVKISRNSVKATIIGTNLCVSRDKLLNFLFYVTAKGLPDHGVS
ncbi:MAG: phytoene/squalene synthase family protein [Thiotrichales bacterium]|nr:phytoene/squalene synthase family protein [Thiotrichales bacterium]